MVTVGKFIDVISVADKKEAMNLLNSIRKNTDATAVKVTELVGFSGLSLKDTVATYSAFMKKETGANVISYEERNGKKVPVQMSLEFEKGAA